MILLVKQFNNRCHSSKLTNNSNNLIEAASNLTCPTWWTTTNRLIPCSNNNNSNRCKCNNREWWWCNSSNSNSRWTKWAKWIWCKIQEWDRIIWWDKEAMARTTKWEVRWAWTTWPVEWVKCSSLTPCTINKCKEVCKVACKEEWEYHRTSRRV